MEIAKRVGLGFIRTPVGLFVGVLIAVDAFRVYFIVKIQEQDWTWGDVAYAVGLGFVVFILLAALGAFLYSRRVSAPAQEQVALPEYLSEETKTALDAALDRAVERRSDALGQPSILLEFHRRDPTVREVLELLEATPPKLRDEEDLFTHQHLVPHTERQRVLDSELNLLEGAKRQAQRLGSDKVLPPHILLAIADGSYGLNILAPYDKDDVLFAMEIRAETIERARVLRDQLEQKMRELANELTRANRRVKIIDSKIRLTPHLHVPPSPQA